jgi:hypothetical protein
LKKDFRNTIGVFHESIIRDNMATGKKTFPRDLQYYKFCLYGFLKNLKFFDPFIILFFREMGLSFLEIGTLYSIREIATNILEIPTGIIADSYGRRRSMISAFISYIISFLIFYHFSSFLMYIPAMIFFAFGEAFRTGTHKAMILEYLKLNELLDFKVHYYGHTRSASQFGSAISSIIAATLVFYSGSYRIIFIASVIPYIADLILMITYPAELDGERLHVEGGSTVSRALIQIKLTVMEFIFIFKGRGSLRAILNSSVFDAMFRTVKDYLQPILKQYALLIPLFIALDNERRISLTVGAVYSILYLLTSLAARSSGDITGRMKSLPYAINMNYLSGTLIILIAGIALYHNLFILSIILFILFYLIENVKKPMNVGYISEKISHRVMATGLSGESQLKMLFVAILSPLMGLLADNYGVGGGLMVMGLILAILFPLVAVGRLRQRA